MPKVFVCVRWQKPSRHAAIVVKPIYIRFYDEFPFFSFRCSVRVLLCSSLDGVDGPFV